MNDHEQTNQRNALERISDILGKLASIDKAIQLTSINTLFYIARHS